MAVTTLVLGGARSGKSRYAQSLLRAADAVTFVAPGPQVGSSDPDWAERIADHRMARPATWSTVESTDLTRAILYARGPVLIDSLGDWVDEIITQAQLWHHRRSALALVSERAQELAGLWTMAPYDAVAVTGEVSLLSGGDDAQGRLAQDALGLVNTAVSAVSDRVRLVLAGRVVDLSNSPVIGATG